MPRSRPSLLTLYTFIFAAGAAQAGPSFDCRRAGNDIEKLICSDAKLAALDVQMADLFGKAMHQSKGSDKADLLAEQRGWIKNRNDCAKRAEPRRNCVFDHYTQRRERLEELVSGEPATEGEAAARGKPVRYGCADGVEMRATFPSGSVAAARVSRGDANWTLEQVTSGSGARYSDGKVVFWVKGREAFFEQEDKTVACRELL